MLGGRGHGLKSRQKPRNHHLLESACDANSSSGNDKGSIHICVPAVNSAWVDPWSFLCAHVEPTLCSACQA